MAPRFPRGGAALCAMLGFTFNAVFSFVVVYTAKRRGAVSCEPQHIGIVPFSPAPPLISAGSYHKFTRGNRHMSLYRQHSRHILFGLLLSFSVHTNRAYAQTPDLRPGNFELGLYAGASYGADNFRPMGGVNLSYSLPKLFLPYAEFSYFPALVRNYSTPSLNYVISAQIEDVHAGVHVRILPHESRIVPYGVVGFGVLHSNTTGNSSGSASACAPLNLSAGCLPSMYSQVSNDPAVNFGAGLRVYHTSYLGYRAEYKLYRPLTGQFSNFFSKLEGGVFFQFGNR